MNVVEISEENDLGNEISVDFTEEVHTEVEIDDSQQTQLNMPASSGSAEAVLQNLDQGLNALMKLLHDHHFLLQSMKCQLQYIKTSLASENPLPVQALIPNIDTLLPPPSQFKRSGVHKNYKVPNSGVMTSDKALEAFEKVEADKVSS